MPQSNESKVYDILPPPFEWVKIPHDKVTLVPFTGHPDDSEDEPDLEDDISEEKYTYLTTEQTITIPTFEIGKYPVTNAQYRQFVKRSGYDVREWWTEAGWKARERRKWAEPLCWQYAEHFAEWNGDDYPVVGVSWFEAVAFCNWLSAASGETITLPTEQQWQRAAQGNDHRAYPWGDVWEADRCNTKETGISQTTPVQRYEGRGDSPFGVVDMAGNASEWTLTGYFTGSEGVNGKDDFAVLRGGGWYSDQRSVRATIRDWSDPLNRDEYFGFRLCRRLKPPEGD